MASLGGRSVLPNRFGQFWRHRVNRGFLCEFSQEWSTRLINLRLSLHLLLVIPCLCCFRTPKATQPTVGLVCLLALSVGLAWYNLHMSCKHSCGHLIYNICWCSDIQPCSRSLFVLDNRLTCKGSVCLESAKEMVTSNVHWVEHSLQKYFC